jgi:U3 small nucleolar RNA-associated protein 10
LARSSLSDTLHDVSLIAKLLDSLAPSVQASSPRSAKRSKTSEYLPDSSLYIFYPDFLMRRSSDDSLPRLTLLTEILGSKSLPGSLDLTTRLLETLNKVVQSLPATQADVIYIQQLLMSAIESTSSKIKVCT